MLSVPFTNVIVVVILGRKGGRQNLRFLASRFAIDESRRSQGLSLDHAFRNRPCLFRDHVNQANFSRFHTWQHAHNVIVIWVSVRPWRTTWLTPLANQQISRCYCEKGATRAGVGIEFYEIR
jgi:hypothetical protein